jgi:hypothetical protein
MNSSSAPIPPPPTYTYTHMKPPRSASLLQLAALHPHGHVRELPAIASSTLAGRPLQHLVAHHPRPLIPAQHAAQTDQAEQRRLVVPIGSSCSQLPPAGAARLQRVAQHQHLHHLGPPVPAQ